MDFQLPKKVLSRKDEITRDFLNLVDQYMTDLLQQRTERRLTASDFAGHLFIAPRHLTNTLRLTTGKSPCDVLEERIIAEAKKLLLDTELPVAEISHRFGYGDTTNFIKFFKGIAGVTPLQFRKKASLKAS
jgi:AraC family transcriptional regulator, regulatory protein of adaptative response / methylphosphotriester-DNA alkyltransferase methyltransferase